LAADTPSGYGAVNGDKRATEQVMAKSSPFKFLQEVREETEKVTWPSRRETFVTTIMVFVMVAVASVFFLIVDLFARNIITLILGIGS
jgi:preprotein translocase subunit SecE